MPISVCRDVMTLLAALLAGLLLAAAPAAAQNSVTDCGDGYHCPAGHACLLGGQCGRLVDAVPGSVRTSTGQWCDPGFREATVRPGSCMPGSYTECTNGLICPSGTQCSEDGQCTGRPDVRQCALRRRPHLLEPRHLHEHRLLPGLRQRHDLLEGGVLRVSQGLRAGGAGTGPPAGQPALTTAAAKLSAPLSANIAAENLLSPGHRMARLGGSSPALTAA